MPKFRKKPVVIEAVQLTERMEIETLEGVMVGNSGDWLITGIAGEVYPCRDDIFQATYEPVDDNTEPTVALPRSEVQRLVLAVQNYYHAYARLGYAYGKEEEARNREQRHRDVDEARQAMWDALAACPTAVQIASEGEDGTDG